MNPDTRFGYNGKILHVNLEHQTSWVEEPDEIFWRRYAGGGLLAAYYLLKGTPSHMDALGAENLLVFSSSVIAGHSYAGLARFTAAAKSPLTGGIGEARCEGPFGQALKGSGYDTIIIHDASTEPIILMIEDEHVSFFNADHMWGKSVGEAADILEACFGEQIHTAVIGQAGENLVRYASIVTDRCYQAARMGLGAVMGAKKLKAVVLKGIRLPAVADAAVCEQLTNLYQSRMAANSLTKWQLDPPGFSCWVHTHGIDTALCTRNYRDSLFESADTYTPEAFMPFYKGEGYCPGCPNNCIKIFAPTDDQRYDARAGGIHQEISGSLGPNCGIADPEILFKANILCHQYGLDPTSLGFILSMAMEWAERGIKTLRAPSGELRFGQGEVLLEMMHLIALREGDGDLLAEGTQRAAERVGGKAGRYAMQVKG